jgi:hypothetical protein
VLARLLLWRLLGLAAILLGAAVLTWMLRGGPGAALRGGSSVHDPLAPRGLHLSGAGSVASSPAMPAAIVLLLLVLCLLALLLGVRWWVRARRRYVRLYVEAYRADHTSVEGLVSMFEALHKRIQHRWWRRLALGQPSVALEVHYIRGGEGVGRALLAVVCPAGSERMVEAALRSAYPNCCVANAGQTLSRRSLARRFPALLRLKKHSAFIKRVKQLDRYELAREPPMDRLMTVMAACAEDAFVQLALTPTPALLERYAKHRYKHHEDRLARARREHLFVRDRSLVEEVELRGGLEVQHRPLYFVDLRVAGASLTACRQIASELRAEGAENRFVERGTAVRQGLLGLYRARLVRGEGNPLPSPRKGVLASTELASLWHLPSIDFSTVPFARRAVPLAPAPPAIMRPRDGAGLLRDPLGTVSIHPQMRRQNTAVPGAVDQGKSSYLAATVAEDLRRERCAVIVLDPKGDAAEAAVSLVPSERTCTLLDFSHPTCGFNPLAVHAPADVIADYVVGALRNLFTDSDIRASSDRYLRNAIIAVLAHDHRSTLWDAARLLSVGEEGYSYRARVGAHVRTLPEFKEIAEFFTAELSAQLADARSMTTAKLDAPVNKLARLLNSPSIKRVLLNDALVVDLDRVIDGGEVLVVKGALGAMGAGNTSVLMQLLMGMLDAALARQQDTVPAERRMAVALKVDEAPLVINRGFAETLALKRSAGLETVACWQTDAQWVDREVRTQLDALFAHRVYFATASVSDAREAASLMMAEYSDTVRPGIPGLSALGRPDARLHLPKHHAIVSWVTPEGRQPPFLATTIPLRIDHERLALHAARQSERGGRHLSDLSQPHWERRTDTTPAIPDGASTLFGSEHMDRAAHREGGRKQIETPHIGAREDARPVPVPDTPVPDTAAESYAELVDLGRAQRVRWARPVTTPRALEPDPLDLGIIELVARMRHVLTTQIHRRFNDRRALTTTQRRLKRLADAGFVERFQFHRRDGGGAPMCYVIAPLGLEILRAHQRLDAIADRDLRAGGTPSKSLHPNASSSVASPSSAPPIAGDRRLRQARHDVHVTGWLLAFERVLGGSPLMLCGAEESVLSPPRRSTPEGRVAIGPRDLRLPGGRAPHDFLRTGPTGERVEVERFETVRPDASIEVPAIGAAVTPGVGRETAPGGAPEAAGTDGTAVMRGRGTGTAAMCLLIERDDRLPAAGTAAAAKLERYDHLLSGWSQCAPRFARRGAATPLVVFLCRDRPRARECARRADGLLGACRAYAGEYPRNWEYLGRTGILFVAERDIHEGLLLAHGVPRLPPEVRCAIAHGDPSARAAAFEVRELLGARAR